VPWSSLKINELTIRDALITARGDAYTDDPDSTVGIEAWAYAREIASCWDDLRRIANEQDPTRAQAWLPRWEGIYGLRPAPQSTAVERRGALGAACLAEGQSPIPSTLLDALRAAAPDLNPTIVNTDSAHANTRIGVGATVPGGITVAPEPAGSTVDWTSTVSYVCVVLTQPAWMDRATYDRLQATLDRLLDKALPSTSTFATVKDGPGGIGFFLDQAGNLDNQRLRV
jgi:hypothetical protein